jgi:hypothetical protein
MQDKIENKHTQPIMPVVGLETTIPRFERAKTVHDCAATVIGKLFLYIHLFFLIKISHMNKQLRYSLTVTAKLLVVRSGTVYCPMNSR